MKHYVGLDTSVRLLLFASSIKNAKSSARTTPSPIRMILVDLLKSRSDLNIERVGLEAGPMSQWLFDGLAKARLFALRHATRTPF